MIDLILPTGVEASEAFEDVAGEELLPEEEAVIYRAVSKRRREFTTARACARVALARLGLPRLPIVPGRRGAPIWPPGVVGSMTHCEGYRAAAVAWARVVAGLGVDAEPNEPLPGGMLEVILCPGEEAKLEQLAKRHRDVHWDRLLFSAKESVFKVWYPLAGTELGFEEADLTFDPVAARFEARLLVEGPVVDGLRLVRLTGRWLVQDGLLATTIVLPRGRRR